MFLYSSLYLSSSLNFCQVLSSYHSDKCLKMYVVLYSVKCSRFPLHWQVAKLFVKKHNLSNSPFLRFRILSPTRNYEIVLSPMQARSLAAVMPASIQAVLVVRHGPQSFPDFALQLPFLKLFDKCVIIKWQKSWTDFDEGCSKVGITAFRTYILEYLAGVQCIPKELLWWVQSFSDLLPPNIMCCGHQLNLQGSNSGKETTYDLGRAATRWNDMKLAFQNSNISNIKQTCVYLLFQVAGGGVLLWRLGGGLRQRHQGFLLPCSRLPVRKIPFQFQFVPKCVPGRQVVASLVVPPMGSPPTMHGPGDWWLVQVIGPGQVIGDQVIRWSGGQVIGPGDLLHNNYIQMILPTGVTLVEPAWLWDSWGTK